MTSFLRAERKLFFLRIADTNEPSAIYPLYKTLILNNYRAIAISLIISLGFLLRIYHLGSLGLIHNEDYVVISAYGILNNFIPSFPSGEVYARAVPFSYIVAVFIKIFGFSEFIVRLPSVIFSTASIYLLYRLGGKMIGWETALLAAFVMSISDWEIMVARTARMYSMFSFFYLLSVYFMLCVTVENRARVRLYSVLSTSVTCFLHALGGILGFIYCCFVFLSKGDKWKTSFVIGSIFLALSFSMLYQSSAYQSGKKLSEYGTQILADNSEYRAQPLRTGTPAEVARGKYLRIYLKLANDHQGAFVAVTIFFALALLTVIVSGWRLGLEKLFILALLAMLLSLYLQQLMLSVYVLAAYFLVGKTYNRGTYWKRSSVLLFVIIGAAVGWTSIDLFTAESLAAGQPMGGGISEAVRESIKTLFSYPPNLGRFYVEKYPVMSLLALCGGLAVILKYMSTSVVGKEQYLLIFVVVPLIAIAFHPTSIIRFYERYASFINPYFILLFAYGTIWLSRTITILLTNLGCAKTVRSMIVILIILGIFISTGLFTGTRSWAFLNMRYGINENVIRLDTGKPFYYPDHQGPSLYVKDNYIVDDIVIAMDILAHYAYFPKADYHLTLGYKSDAEYWLGSSSIRSSEHLEEVLNKHGQRKIWIVLSGQKLKDYESRREFEKLMSVMRSFRMEIKYLGRDGLSDVYLMNRRAGRRRPDRM